MQPSVTEIHDYGTTDCTVRAWIDSLKAAKKGAKFERVVVYVTIRNIDLEGYPINSALARERYTNTEGQHISTISRATLPLVVV